MTKNWGTLPEDGSKLVVAKRAPHAKNVVKVLVLAKREGLGNIYLALSQSMSGIVASAVIIFGRLNSVSIQTLLKARANHDSRSGDGSLIDMTERISDLI